MSRSVDLREAEGLLSHDAVWTACSAPGQPRVPVRAMSTGHIEGSVWMLKRFRMELDAGRQVGTWGRERIEYWQRVFSDELGFRDRVGHHTVQIDPLYEDGVLYT